MSPHPSSCPSASCRLSLIGRVGETFRPNGQPVRVGTKYRRLAARYFDERKIAHEIVPLTGSVELAAALTDVVVDLIESGVHDRRERPRRDRDDPFEPRDAHPRARFARGAPVRDRGIRRAPAGERGRGDRKIMLKIVETRTRAGRRELEALLKSRRGASPDFGALKQILPVVEDVLRRGAPALRRANCPLRLSVGRRGTPLFFEGCERAPRPWVGEATKRAAFFPF